tara:strand:- start:823 stop:1302 length:480 start_codon:yes stop_codon:yes gene_type:complete
MAYKFPTATKGKQVSVHYVGTFDSGDEFDNSYTRGKPITFQLGAMKTIAGFEQAIVGLSVGEKKKVSLTPDQAYGEIKEKLFQTYSKADFPDDFELKLGEMITIPTESGQVFPATIYGIDEETVVLNFNHPMAGKNLNFEIELVQVNNVQTETEEENIG